MIGYQRILHIHINIVFHDQDIANHVLTIPPACTAPWQERNHSGLLNP